MCHEATVRGEPLLPDVGRVGTHPTFGGPGYWSDGGGASGPGNAVVTDELMCVPTASSASRRSRCRLLLSMCPPSVWTFTVPISFDRHCDAARVVFVTGFADRRILASNVHMEFDAAWIRGQHHRDRDRARERCEAGLWRRSDQRSIPSTLPLPAGVIPSRDARCTNSATEPACIFAITCPRCSFTVA